MNAYQPIATVAGRVLLSLIFLISGVGKLADPSGTMQYIEAAGLPLPSVAYVGALVGEIGGGLALLVGFGTRWAAAALCAFTLLAAFTFHNHFSDPDQMVHFLKNVAIAGGLLYVVGHGAGTFSLDDFAFERRNRSAHAR